MNMNIETANLEIPLRYYKGWTIVFTVKTERFSCPLLCLFGFLSVPDLERAVDRALEYRAGK